MKSYISVVVVVPVPVHVPGAAQKDVVIGVQGLLPPVPGAPQMGRLATVVAAVAMIAVGMALALVRRKDTALPGR